LSDKHKAFCEEYAIDMNARRSAREVGYNERYSYQVLARDDVRAYIDWLNETSRNERIASAQEIKERLTMIARGDTQEAIITPDGRTIMKGTYIKDQTAALKLLGQHYKLFTEVQEIKNETVIEISFEDDFGEEF
jgi:Phage terminase, small subunit